MTSLAHQATENRSVAEFTEQAYLNYAMYVIMDRALPHISDGFKTCTTPYCVCHE